MRIALAVLFVASCQRALTAELKTKDVTKTDKRALVEGNSALDKRASQVVTVSTSPTPGIVYADTKETLAGTSPSQQVYATPVPQVAKISDVLTGHGASFPTAIESHLYSPIQVYQPRLGSPTTYEISAPVQSQLAYTEHKTYQRPQQNSIQYYEPQRPEAQKQLARVTVNFTPQHQFQPQQLYLQPPILYHQRQQQQIVPTQQLLHFGQLTKQPIYNQQLVSLNQQPRDYNQQHFGYNQQAVDYNQQHFNYNQQPLTYNQQPVTYNQQPVTYNQQPLTYNQQLPAIYNQQPLGYNPHNQQQIAVFHQAQTGVTYAEQVPDAQKYNGPLLDQTSSQREVKISQSNPLKVLEKSTSVQQKYNNKGQGAVSFASFSQSQPSSNYIPLANSFVPPPTNYLSSNTKLDAPAPTNAPAPKPGNGAGITYYRPQFSQSIPQLYSAQAQVYPNNQELVQNQGFAQQPVAVPTFPAVQYFGKFAPAIFGGYQQ